MLLGMSLPTLWTPTAYHSTPDFQNLKNTPLIQPSIHFILEAPQNQNVLASLSRPFLLWNGKISSGSNLKVCNVIKTRDDLCHSTAHRLKSKFSTQGSTWPGPCLSLQPCHVPLCSFCSSHLAFYPTCHDPFHPQASEHTGHLIPQPSCNQYHLPLRSQLKSHLLSH